MLKRSSRLVWLCCFFVASASCMAGDWTVAFDQGFSAAAAPSWRVSGGAIAEGALVTAGGEANATLDRVFDGKAIRVSYDATMTPPGSVPAPGTAPGSAPGSGGKVSDLSVFIGNVFMQFGGSYNSVTRIRQGSFQTGDFGARLKIGQTHKVVAEINGSVARLSIDGKEVGIDLLPAPPDQLKVSLYCWAGVARFENLRVETRATADPAPPELVALKVYGKQTPQTLAHLRDWPRPELNAAKPASVGRAEVPLIVDFGPAAKPGMIWPVTRGVPLPKGALHNPDHARVVDEAGNEIPTQRTVTATWSERGSIRWLLLDFLLPVTDKAPKLVLQYGNDVRAMPVADPVAVRQTDDDITLDSGAAQFTVSRKRGTVLESASLNGRQILGPAEAYYDTRQGWHYTTSNDHELDVAVEMAGPIRSVIRSRGWYTDAEGRRACYFTRRLYVYKGLPWARLFTTWTVTVDTSAYTFTDVGVRFTLPGSAPLAEPVTVLAAARNEGYVITGTNRMRTQDAPQDITAGGVHGAPGGKPGGPGGASIGCFEMTRQWPAALTTTGDSLTFHGFSNLAGLDLDMTDAGLRKLWGPTYDMFNASRGSYPAIADRKPNGCGFAKTHELIIALHPAGDVRTHLPGVMDTFQQPVMVASDPVHNCDTGVVGPGEYHPLDRRNFEQAETSIEKQRDQLLDVLDRVEPWYGFWDYGAGVPHHMQGDFSGKGPITYNGYRRCYDMGYRQPLVPWMMHLRSAQRQWLSFAVRNARCMSDARFFHWTNERLGRHVGMFVQDHGTWAWDTNLAGFGFNCYTPTLLLNYHTTGYERAMDVHTEVLDEYCRTGRPYYVAMTGVWLGNTAEAYRTTWEPRYKKAFDEAQKTLLDSVCKLCGGVNNNPDTSDENHDYHGSIHRASWVEYGVLHAMQVEGHDPAITDILVRDGVRRCETKHHTEYDMMATARLLAHRATKDKRIAREGRDVLDHYMKEGHGSSLGFSGVAYLRDIPYLMRLAMEPGLNDVATSVNRRYPPPLLLMHQHGRKTKVVITTSQKITREQTGLTVRDPQGNPVDGPGGPGGPAVSFDPLLGELAIEVDSATPTGVYTIELEVPRLFNGDLDSLRYVRHAADEKIAIAIPEGYQHFSPDPLPRLWFRVPPGTKQFRVRNNVTTRTLTVTRPDGVAHRAAGEWHTVTVPDNMPDWPWSIDSTNEDHANFQCVKLYGVPAMVSLSREAVFTMDNAPKTAADYEPLSSETGFLPGRLGQALHLNSSDRLIIPLGSAVDAHSRQRLSTRRGTIEFFFKLNANPYFAGVAGLPMSIRPDDSATFKNWTRKWLMLDWKNAVVMLLPDGRASAGVRFAPWDPFVGMIDLRPGRWYHLALVWDASKSFSEWGQPTPRMQLRVFLDGRNLTSTIYDEPHWLADAYEAPLPADVMEWISAGHNVLIDELRVSDIERVDYRGPKTPITYPVPDRPYQHDEHTLILMHFDNNVTATGPGGEKFEASFNDVK